MAKWAPWHDQGIRPRHGPYFGHPGSFRRFFLLPDLLVRKNILVKIPSLLDFASGSESNKYENRQNLPDILDYQK